MIPVRSWPIAAIKFDLHRMFFRLHRIVVCGLSGIILLVPLMAISEEVATPPSPVVPPPEIMSSVDYRRDYLSGRFVEWAKNIDRFFGDARNYQEANDSVIQMDISRVMGYGGDPKIDVSFRANVKLPNTEKKLHLLIETNPDENIAVNQNNPRLPSSAKISTPRSYAAALRYEKIEAERWHFSTDGGVKLAGLDSTPFVRARVSLSMPLAQWRLKVADSVFWFNTIGAGESTLIDFERTLSEQHLFRASSNATWLNDTQNFELSQSFSVFHTLDERAALLYQISAVGVSKPQTEVSDYVILMTYRSRIHREWVFFEISPQIHFPRVLDYRTSWQLSMRLEFLLDKSR